MKSVCDRYNRALDSLLQLVCSAKFDIKLIDDTAVSSVFHMLHAVLFA